MKLSSLHTGETGVIVKVSGHGGFRKRIVEMGFVKGKTVRVILNAPLRDPIEYEIMGYKISLRREEAALIEVVGEEEVAERDAAASALPPLRPSGEDLRHQCAALEKRMQQMASENRRTISVALVGNPNCGKTSLFNVASGGHEHVGNYSGVTVDAKEGTFRMKVRMARAADGSVSVVHGPACSGGCGGTCASCTATTDAEQDTTIEERLYTFNIVDLPGTYSLSAYSPEELYVRRHLIEQMPDVIINVVDSSNLERNLYLTTQLIDMHQRMVVALNMYDELKDRGDQLDREQLGRLLGVPMVPTVSRSGQGIAELFETVVAVYENRDNAFLERHIHVNHGAELEQSIDRLKLIFQKNTELRTHYSTRFLAIKFLEGDQEVGRLVETLPEHDELIAARFEETRRLEAQLHDTPENALTDAKYGFIQGALRETFRPQAQKEGRTMTEKIDAIATNRFLGFPLFFFLLFLIFYATFTLGAYPMDWIDWLVAKISDFVSYAMPEGMLRDMITDGAISGVGAVIVFLPNIMILYLFISLLEDSGYMARAAFITDKLMHHIGLHGKSFIPMVMGFGCNVPAVMATRTIENPKSRLVTMLVTPFMSCSARIPIYVILIAAFFPQGGAWVMLGLYALGIIAAVLMARLFSRFLVEGPDLPFVMELPPYRIPTAKAVLRHTWEKGRQYLQKMGGIILVFSLVIWALNYFPLQEENTQTAQTEQAEQVDKTQERVTTPPLPLERGSGGEAGAGAVGVSYLERIGQFVAPVMSPMHFDWRMTVGILSGVGAKELVVSTLAVMYAGEDDIDTDAAAGDSHLLSALRAHMTLPSALAYMVFILFYFPCFATIAAIKNESGGWRWALFAAGYTTVFAYVLALLTYLAAAALF